MIVNSMEEKKLHVRIIKGLISLISKEAYHPPTG